MPLEHRHFGLNAALALGLLKKLERGASQNLEERDVKYDVLAYSDPNKVVTLLCHNWIRDPWTGGRGIELPDLEILRVYEREVDCGIYHQRFAVLMFSLVCTKPREFDSKKVVWAKNYLRPRSRLGFDQAERADRMRELQAEAEKYEVEKRYAFAFGRPIEGEKYGKGALLERTIIEPGRGGIIEPRTSHGRLDLRGNATGRNEDHRGP